MRKHRKEPFFSRFFLGWKRGLQGMVWGGLLGGVTLLVTGWAFGAWGAKQGKDFLCTPGGLMEGPSLSIPKERTWTFEKVEWRTRGEERRILSFKDYKNLYELVAKQRKRGKEEDSFVGVAQVVVTFRPGSKLFEPEEQVIEVDRQERVRVSHRGKWAYFSSPGILKEMSRWREEGE